MSIQLGKLLQNTEVYLETLTSRELDVLACLLENSASKKIGPILQITIETVDTHIANIGKKLSQNGRAQIVDCLRNTNHINRLHERYVCLVRLKSCARSFQNYGKLKTSPIS